MTKRLDTRVAVSAAIAREGCQHGNWEHWGGGGEAEDAKPFRTQPKGSQSPWEPSHGIPRPSQRHSPVTVTASEQVQQALLNKVGQRNRRNFL